MIKNWYEILVVTKQLENETLEQGTLGLKISALFTQIVNVVIAIETPDLSRNSIFSFLYHWLYL